MKKTFANIRTLAALLIASAALAACSNDDGAIIDSAQPAQQQAPQVYTLTLQAGKADNAQTRALQLETNGDLTAYWKDGDEVTVMKGATVLGTLTAKDASGATCTFSGKLTGEIRKDDPLTLTYHPVASLADFGSQNGQLVSAADYDMATALVHVASVSSGEITISESKAEFKTQTAVLKITLQDGVGSALNASKLTISAGGTDIFTLTSIATSGFLYLALPSAERVATAMSTSTEALAALPITFTATAGGNTYIATKTGYPFAAGKYYATELKMAKVVRYSSEINVPAGDHWYIGGTSEYNNITIGEGATVTIDSYLQMQYASIICSGNATIILPDETTTIIFGGRIKAGPEGTTLTIKGNTGELKIQDVNSSGAAIGASDGDACGNIVIEGGVITATGAMDAGIGASSNAKCGNITISGGTVTATGSNGAGIGASNAECGDITISGGIVTATGGAMAAGIGSGSSDTGWCGNITISGGTVTATGGAMAAGIGTGAENGCGDITISGGTVEATGGNGAAGIGGGNNNSYCGDINITSGVTSVTATKGEYAPNSIGAGAGDDSEDITVNIQAGANVIQN